jgi:hypothetical protein
MGYKSDVVIPLEESIPSHLEKEMMEELTRLRKQITTIQEILEGSNEKHTDDSSTGDNRL